MFLLGASVIIGIILVFAKNGIKAVAIIGGVVGFFVGSSLGIAGGGTAVNAAFIFAGIGFIIGGLISKSTTKETLNQKSSVSIKKRDSDNYFYNLPPEVANLIKEEKEFELAQLLVYLEKKGDSDIARQIMRIIRNENLNLGNRVKQIKNNIN